MNPFTVGPTPHILVTGDDRTAPLADLARGMRFVVAQQDAVIVLVAYGPGLPGGAQIFL